jgi:hypothetical protein
VRIGGREMRGEERRCRSAHTHSPRAGFMILLLPRDTFRLGSTLCTLANDASGSTHSLLIIGTLTTHPYSGHDFKIMH